MPAVQIGVQARYTYLCCTYYTNLLLEVPYLLWLYCYGYTYCVHQPAAAGAVQLAPALHQLTMMSLLTMMPLLTVMYYGAGRAGALLRVALCTVRP